jgi:hypothetical protein
MLRGECPKGGQHSGWDQVKNRKHGTKKEREKEHGTILMIRERYGKAMIDVEIC